MTNCMISPIIPPDHSDPALLIAQHMIDHHESDITHGWDDDGLHHLALLHNDASNATGINAELILDRSENYINDWSR